MHENQAKSLENAFVLSVVIFVLWIVLCGVGLAIGTFYDGRGYTVGNYVPLLVVSLILAFGIVPFLPGLRSATYADYLKDTGILVRIRWSTLLPLGLFLVISCFGFYYDLRGDLQNIVQFHRNLGMSMILLSSIQPAISEEIVIRGAIYFAIRRFSVPLSAILGTAFAFGLIHLAQGPARFFFAFTAGLALGVLRWRTHTVWAGSVVHFMINFGTPVPAWIACLQLLLPI